MGKRRYLFASIGMIVLMMFLATSARAAASLEVGQPFPDLVLPALDDGRPLSITNFRGQKVVLHVFASW